jgi:hypothetical protein
LEEESMIVAESKSGGAYIVPKFKPRDGQHYWIQIGKDSLEEALQRVPRLLRIKHKHDGQHYSWHGEYADQVCDMLRNYCPIRGPVS